MSQQETTRNLTDGHRNMERVLTLVRFQIDAMQDGVPDTINLRLLGNALVYMRDYPGVNHHPVEEMIFGKLMDYSQDHRIVCNQLASQHRGFSERENALLQHIRKARLGDGISRQHVKDLGVAYCADHSSHIRSEETEIFPGAQRWLTPLDWQEVARRSRETIHPELAQHELKRYDNLYDRLMAQDSGADDGPVPLSLVRASQD
jgi:hemerythrin-like domain-containing protein